MLTTIKSSDNLGSSWGSENPAMLSVLPRAPSVLNMGEHHNPRINLPKAPSHLKDVRMDNEQITTKLPNMKRPCYDMVITLQARAWSRICNWPRGSTSYKTAIRWTQSAVSSLLNGVKPAIRCKLFVIIKWLIVTNWRKSEICSCLMQIQSQPRFETLEWLLQSHNLTKNYRGEQQPWFYIKKLATRWDESPMCCRLAGMDCNMSASCMCLENKSLKFATCHQTVLDWLQSLSDRFATTLQPLNKIEFFTSCKAVTILFLLWLFLVPFALAVLRHAHSQQDW